MESNNDHACRNSSEVVRLHVCPVGYVSETGADRPRAHQDQVAERLIFFKAERRRHRGIRSPEALNPIKVLFEALGKGRRQCWLDFFGLFFLLFNMDSPFPWCFFGLFGRKFRDDGLRVVFRMLKLLKYIFNYLILTVVTFYTATTSGVILFVSLDQAFEPVFN